jgi:hypothetical protein
MKIKSDHKQKINFNMSVEIDFAFFLIEKLVLHSYIFLSNNLMDIIS